MLTNERLLLLCASEVQAFTSFSLGASLLANWDAELPTSLTLSGASVTTWTDIIGGLAPTQSVGGSKPTYSATSLNNRPGVTGDGVDDYLQLTGIGSLPSGASPCEIWALFNNNGDIGPGDTRTIFSYGGALTISRRLDIVPGSAPGFNKAQLTIGTGAGSVTIMSGDIVSNTPHVVRCTIGATQGSITVDGGSATTGAAVPATGTDRIRIFSTAGTTPIQFSPASVNLLSVTSALGAVPAAQYTDALKTRGSIA